MNYEDVSISKCDNGFCAVFEGTGTDEDGCQTTVIKRLVCHSKEELLLFLHQNFLEPIDHPSDLS